MKPYTLISSDCHAAPPMKDYRAFVEPRFRDDFDRWLEQTEKKAAAERRKRIGVAPCFSLMKVCRKSCL